MGVALVEADHATTTGAFTSVRLTPGVGSVVTGLDLKAPIDANTAAALRALVVDRGVVFIPKQGLTPQQHLAFAGLFGTVGSGNKYDQSASDLPPGVSAFNSRDRLYGRVSRWHIDAQPAEAPRAFAINQAIRVPEVGGDTLWASGAVAYERLSEPLKRLVEPLQAVHAFTPLEASMWNKGGIPYHWNEHPVVTVHPETGRRSLYVSPRWTWEIVGLKPHESQALLKLLYDHILQHEHIVRYRWSEGDIAVWDNRSTLHYAVDDYDDAERIVHTVGTLGERPVGIA